MLLPRSWGRLVPGFPRVLGSVTSGREVDFGAIAEDQIPYARVKRRR